MPAQGVQKMFDKVAALRNTELFCDLSDDALKSLASHAIVRHLEPEQVLCSEYEEAAGMYVVVRGQLRSVRQDKEGREQVLSTETAGAVLALAPAFNGGHFYSTMIAERASDILCIQRRDLHEFCRQHMDVFWSVARVFAHRVRHYAELIETLALRNVEQRVAQHLLSTCQDRSVQDGADCIVELTMTQAELASRVGSTREGISRALSHLQQRGLIQLKGVRLVIVPDIRALIRFAGMEQQLERAPHIHKLSSEIA